MTKKILTVFGSSHVEPLSELYQNAYLIGRTAAELGWTVCNGGYGGTMEAAAKGAVEAGGHAIGVTCTRFGRGGPNPYIRQEIPTFDLFQRLNTLIQLGRAYLVLPGGTGTLAELALVWELSNKRLLAGGRPLALWGDYWKPVVGCLHEMQPDAVELLTISDAAALCAMLGNIEI